jgi:nondiscriminating aspartyl-tRNA synthetase
VPPFGNLLNIDNYFDEEIKTKTMSAFNCGLTTESIVMKSEDLISLTDPKWGCFSKEPTL